MIDFHSHILPNVDDGSTSIEESIKLIVEASKVGFTGIISTSHYLQNYYEHNEEERMQLIQQMKRESEQFSCEMFEKMPELYLGSEIYISTDIIKFIENKQASTINQSQYVLFELPLNSKALYVKEVIYNLIENGYRPIIAHPERYSCVKENVEYAVELKNMGVMFQANYGSIIGMYGSGAKKTLKKLLKLDLISFLGSDVHRTEQIYPYVPKALKKLRKIIPEEKLQELTTTNAEKVLENKEIFE